MTTNDRLQEAIEKYGTPLSDNRVTINLDDIPRIAYRAGIEAAIAVQPVPTDAEIERAIDRLELATIEWARSNEPSRTTASTGPLGDKTVELHDALLRLIAAQRSAAQREALEAVRAKLGKLRETFPPTPDYDSSERMIYGCGYDVGLLGIKRHIDAELAKEDGNE